MSTSQLYETQKANPPHLASQQRFAKPTDLTEIFFSPVSR